MRCAKLAGLGLLLVLSACSENKDGGGPTEIIIDNLGIAHIYAANDEELFYAAGYQMATDRLYQAAMLRRFAMGRRTEVVGERALEFDRFARMLDFTRWGRLNKQATEHADPERASLIQAWVDGINKRIQEVQDGEVELPFGFGPDERDFLPELWADEDPYIILKAAMAGLDKTIEFEVALTLLSEIFPDVVGAVDVFKPAHNVFCLPPGERPRSRSARRGGAPVGPTRRPADLSEEEIRLALQAVLRLVRGVPGRQGSNNWAVDGQYTGTGRSLIAGDPHLGFDFLGSPFPLHLNSKDRGGSYNVAGFVYPGTPGITLGFNEKLMWTSTTSFGDVMDIWQLQEEGGGIRIGDEIIGARERTEQFIVRGPEDPYGEGTVEEVVFRDVDDYGVVIPEEIIGLPLPLSFLMNWTGFTGRPARWFMEFNRAESIDEFEAAVDRVREVNQSWVAADANGISYRLGLDVPVRHNLSADNIPIMAMDASDPASLWTGEMLTRDQLASSRGGEQGFLVTANNEPYGFTADGLVHNDPWFFGAFFGPGYRAKRITDELTRLTARGDVTLEDMQILQMDTHSTLAENMLPLLVEAHANMASDDSLAEFRDQPDLDRVVELLTSEWDMRMDRDSAGALAYQAFLHFVSEQVVQDDITEMGYDLISELQAIYLFKLVDMLLRGQYPNGDRVLQEGRDWSLLEAARRTAAWLVTHYGSVDPSGYQYSDFKRVNLDDGLGFGMPVFKKSKDGGEDTVNVSQNITFEEDASEWVTTYVSVERSVGTFREDGSIEVWMQFPLGAHADPDSTETAQANDAWINGNYRKFLFDRDEIEANQKERFELEPRE